MKSILQSTRECYISGKAGCLHRHHIYGGPNRKISEANGFWVWLAPEWHNLSDAGVHMDRSLDLLLKRDCQEKFEQTHSREEFMALIGRNYLEDDEDV